MALRYRGFTNGANARDSNMKRLIKILFQPKPKLIEVSGADVIRYMRLVEARDNKR